MTIFYFYFSQLGALLIVEKGVSVVSSKEESLWILMIEIMWVKKIWRMVSTNHRNMWDYVSGLDKCLFFSHLEMSIFLSFGLTQMIKLA